uniref:hypothetical protein n=1 Tax=Mucilaginibacter psychrotolerans TaxID=1524096 RepID=UPI001F018A58|nr:hypothetical protein [Mucilaginibacter psychrotolerans]
MLTPDKIIETFVKVDNFCKEFEVDIANHQLDAGNYKVRDRKASLADSEIITILVTFHSGHFTNLKHFYLAHICMCYKDCFPGMARTLKG